MNNYKTPKGIVRNDERRNGLVRIIKGITTTAAEFVKIKHEAIIKRTDAVVKGLNETTIGIIDLSVAEDNYTIEDDEERKELEEKEKED
jgi:hypothetical protein